MLVSILIPCYNAERWIHQCIESALAQTWTEKEVIVVDDGSTDNSLGIIQSFKDRIRFETGPNRGGNAARNRLLELSRGEWVQYLDADDYLLPDKIERQTACATADADIVFGPILVEELLPDPVLQGPFHLGDTPDAWVLWAQWRLPQTGAALWKRTMLTEIGGWTPDLPCCQEHELYLRALSAGKRFVYCDQPGAVYRFWSTQTVSRRDKNLVNQQRLRLLESAEKHLRSVGRLSPARLQAINETRFRIARFQWPTDHEAATSVMRQVLDSQPKFHPASSSGAGFWYRIVYQLAGFRHAEWIAATLRPFRRRVDNARYAA
jgi:glycosyltransferase involved in cell wall biosynthesis